MDSFLFDPPYLARPTRDAEQDPGQPEPLADDVHPHGALLLQREEPDAVRPHERVEREVAGVAELPRHRGVPLERVRACGEGGAERGLEVLDGLEEPEHLAPRAERGLEGAPSRGGERVGAAGPAAASEEEPGVEAREVLDGAVGLCVVVGMK